MKKVLFTTLSIIAVAAMMFVSCKKDDGKDTNQEEQKPQVEEELVGTWTITGEAYSWDQTKGVAMTESDNVWTAAEVSIKGEGIKFVKDASWNVNLGATEGGAKEDDAEFDLKKDGENIKGAKDGVYSVTLNLLTKKAKIKFVKDLEPEGPNWAAFDYTPSDEYKAETNLWKAVDDANGAKFFSFLNPGWGTAINDNVEAETLDFLTKTQSTYELHFEKATDGRWQNQFYIFPGAEANFVALNPAKKYRVKLSVTSTASFDAFFKFSKYIDQGPKHEGDCMWQPDGYTDEHPSTMTLVADTPLVLETELTGQDAKNVIFIFDFGFNPANTRICIKDIIIEEVESPAAVIDGNFDEWAALEGNTTGPNSQGQTTTMKAVAIGSSIYVYLKVETAEANATNHVIDSESYVYFSFDKDNDAATGSTDWYRTGADDPDNPKYRVKFASDGLREGLAAEAANASVKCVDDATNRVLQMELKFDKAALGTDTTLSEVGMKIFALGYIPGEFTGNVALTF